MDKVCVLLSTYNGTKYLKEQIDSLLIQEGVDIHIFARDDGSSDGTQEILNLYVSDKLSWYQGDNKGPAHSFIELLKKAPICDYYAFCDQDDVWDKHKLKAAIDLIKSTMREIKPVFYYSNVKVVDENLELIKMGRAYKNEKSLHQVLLHNNAIGCTTVINNVLRKIAIDKEPSNFYMHDWLLYKLCLAVDGQVIFDDSAYINYRQHSNNSVGFEQKKRSIKELLTNKSLCLESITAKDLLDNYYDVIPQNNIIIIDVVANYKTSFKKKIRFLIDSRYYQTKGIQRLKERVAILRNRK